jgi:hypothetical protein
LERKLTLENTRLLTRLKQQLRRKNFKADDICSLPNGKWTIWGGISFVGTYDTPQAALAEIERMSNDEKGQARTDALSGFRPTGKDPLSGLSKPDRGTNTESGESPLRGPNPLHKK